ncbi:hypothetical protein CBR_g36375 [Chara braunii]|uniref:Reverse transcriptase/retrotransposon-derived protein RNase H-like domain-containing protein n=1 Tax=Chara braunii TaxID=69332 RepID=A0A388LKI7_CHABU|nr:hypothetical protein CBR_g36375 [Chara braunii]|eukprot:GBG82846.1 hypothetical protein CBR_g36375 [Chara braunii]
MAKSFRATCSYEQPDEIGLCFLQTIAVAESSPMDLSSDPRVVRLLDEFVDIFESPTGVVPDRPISHEIILEDGVVPPKGCIYRMSEEELTVLRAQLNDLLDKGWIRPSSSPYGLPVLVVRKKDKDLRLCIDFASAFDGSAFSGTSHAIASHGRFADAANPATIVRTAPDAVMECARLAAKPPTVGRGRCAVRESFDLAHAALRTRAAATERNVAREPDAARECATHAAGMVTVEVDRSDVGEFASMPSVVMVLGAAMSDCVNEAPGAARGSAKCVALMGIATRAATAVEDHAGVAARTCTVGKDGSAVMGSAVNCHYRWDRDWSRFRAKEYCNGVYS